MIPGDTGPLVYPAGFVYIYTALYYLTSRGQSIRLAQYLFIVIYLAQIYLVLRLYTKSRKVPPYVIVFSIFTSYRIHSIYVLRLFNDPIAILLLYIALNLYLDGRWTLGSIFLSLGVSVKMNVLLFAPAILLLYIVNLGFIKTAIQLAVCAIVQLMLGAPFLLSHPIEYVKGSFDLGRIFEHKWTVNYRFLPREIFENPHFHLLLLCIHLTLLCVFFKPSYTFIQSYFRLRNLQIQLQPQIDAKNAEVKKNKGKIPKLRKKEQDNELTEEQQKFLNKFEKTMKKSTGQSEVDAPPPPPPKPEETQKYEIFFDKAVQLVLLPIFLSNFIGIVCARSLHYQFYIWYFHSLPYLVWYTDFNTSLKFLLLGCIEYAWNTYPSTDLSSALLHGCHIILLVGIGQVLFLTKAKTDENKNKSD